MPGLNGFQATRELGRDPATAGIPVIMVTTEIGRDRSHLGPAPGCCRLRRETGVEQDLVDKARAALAR